MAKTPYYITTAIAYTSGKPHIGNTYEIVLADAIARYRRKQGYDVFFQTGTDEHGQKIESRAAAAGKTPKEFVDEVAAGRVGVESPDEPMAYCAAWPGAVTVSVADETPAGNSTGKVSVAFVAVCQ